MRMLANRTKRQLIEVLRGREILIGARLHKYLGIKTGYTARYSTLSGLIFKYCKQLEKPSLVDCWPSGVGLHARRISLFSGDVA